MPSTAKIKERIAEIVSRPNNVSFTEIKWVMDSLGAIERSSKHGRLFRLEHRRIMINEHNNGKRTVPKYSVNEFIKLMTDLGLYEGID